MFKKLPYKQKVKLLPIAFLLSLLLIYSIAIRDTFKIKQNCNLLLEESKNAGDAPQQIAIIQGKLNLINSIAGRDSVNETDPLLTFISSSEAGQVSLVDYQPVHTFQHENYQVETRIAVFESSFTNLLKFLYHLEKEFKSGKLVSVKFQTETNLKTERKRLLMTIYIQSIKNEEKNTTST